MIFINRTIICGRLVRDPEVRIGGTTTVATYSVAVDRKYKKEGEPSADFFNCTAFGKSAEFAEKYLRQGTKVIVQGHMQQDNYTDKNGNKVYAWKLIVDEQEFAESKAAANDAKAQSALAEETKYVDIADGIEEDLPFI